MRKIVIGMLIKCFHEIDGNKCVIRKKPIITVIKHGKNLVFAGEPVWTWDP